MAASKAGQGAAEGRLERAADRLLPGRREHRQAWTPKSGLERAALVSLWRVLDPRRRLPIGVRLEIERAHDRAAGSYLDDGDRRKAEIEVPEVLEREVEEDARHDPEDAAVAEDQRPTAFLGASCTVAEDMVAVYRAGFGAVRHFAEEPRQRSLTPRRHLRESLASGGGDLHRPASPARQRVAEADVDLLFGESFPHSLGDLAEAGIWSEWGSGAAGGGP